jgi:hypothetical protein
MEIQKVKINVQTGPEDQFQLARQSAYWTRLRYKCQPTNESSHNLMPLNCMTQTR